MLAVVAERRSGWMDGWKDGWKMEEVRCNEEEGR